MFDTVLVANRGEIAVRVIRHCAGWASARSLSTAIPTPARGTLSRRHRRATGTRRSAEKLFDGARVLDAAVRTGSQAIHPGYGFLSENAEFAAACQRAGWCS